MDRETTLEKKTYNKLTTIIFSVIILMQTYYTTMNG